MITFNTSQLQFSILFNKALKNWHWLVLSVVVCVGLGVSYYYTTTPKITSRVSIMLRVNNSTGAMMDQLDGMMNIMGMTGNMEAEDEVAVISSNDMIYAALDKLQLWDDQYIKREWRWEGEYPNKTFEVECVALTKKARLKTIVVEIEPTSDGMDVEVRMGRFQRSKHHLTQTDNTIESVAGQLRIRQVGTAEADAKYRIIHRPKESVVAYYHKNLFISQHKKGSNIIDFSITSQLPNRDVAILNQLIEQYTLAALMDKNQLARNTEDFINDRIAVISGDLVEAEDAVSNYKKENQIANLSEEAKVFIKANSEEQKELATLEAQLSMVAYVQQMMEDDSKAYNLIPATICIEDASLTQFIAEYNQLLLNRMRVLRTAKENSPVLTQLDDQLTTMRQNISASVKSISETMEIQRKMLEDRERIAGQTMRGVPEKEKEYVRVVRQQGMKEQIYVYLCKKKEENALMMAAEPSPVKIVDSARKDILSSSPQFKNLMIVCVLLGLAFPMGVIMLIQLLFAKVDDEKEFQNAVKAPYLGTILLNSRGKHIAISEGENTVSAELFRQLRTNLRFTLSSDVQSPVILVSSCINGEGKSYVATNLALSLAILGKKVALVGLDIRKPMLSMYFGLSQKGCLTNYLSEDGYQLEDVVIPHVGHANLDLIPAGIVPPNPNELLQSERLDMFFAQLKEKYEYVIVDSAPITMVSDTYLLDRIADMTLFVSRANYTKMEMIEVINEVIEKKRFKNVACLLNGVKKVKAGYGYGITH